jgi:hypothetical protein
MTTDIKEIKKKIGPDWQSRFPGLGKYSSNKLYKIIGPLVAGIELITIPRMECYRPHIVIYPLWGNVLGTDVKACMEYPAIMFQLLNKKNLQFDVPFAKHELLIDEAAECLRQSIPFSFESDVKLDDLYELIDKHSRHILIRSDDGKLARMEVIKLFTALYAGNDAYVKKIWDNIHNNASHWNPVRLAFEFGNADSWLVRLQQTQENKQEFIHLIENNKKDKDLAKLQQGLLIS